MAVRCDDMVSQNCAGIQLCRSGCNVLVQVLNLIALQLLHEHALLE